MADCLKNIVSIRDLCGGTPSLSGYDLMSAPEISPKRAAAVADERYVSGLNLLKAKLDFALLDIENDFTALLATNGYALQLKSDTYSTGLWNTGMTNAPYNGERGLTIHKAYHNSMKALIIKSIELYPTVTQNAVPVYIYDNGLQYTYSFNLVADQINVFQIEHKVSGAFARIVMSNAGLITRSGTITCKTGCNGSLPNPCGYVKGWNGTQEITGESFGIHASFTCQCDYSGLLCDLARVYSGKLIWLKARALVMEEALISTRLNTIVMYSGDKLKELKAEVEAEYVSTWNSLVSSLPTLLKKYNGDCITCTGIKTVTNV